MSTLGKIGMVVMMAALCGCDMGLQLCNFSDVTVEYRYGLLFGDDGKGGGELISVTVPPGDCAQETLEITQDEIIEIIVLDVEGQFLEQCSGLLDPEGGLFSGIRAEWDGETLMCTNIESQNGPPQ